MYISMWAYVCMYVLPVMANKLHHNLVSKSLI